MVGIIKSRLKGTILEPMFALMIIMFTLTATFTVAIKVNQQGNIQQIIRATSIANKILNSSLTNKDFLSSDFKEEGLNIERKTEWYFESDHLMILSVKVSDNKGRLLILRRKIIIIEETTE
jgi:hypothetical protein